MAPCPRDLQVPESDHGNRLGGDRECFEIASQQRCQVGAEPPVEDRGVDRAIVDRMHQVPAAVEATEPG